jgi:hypothetical protein
MTCPDCSNDAGTYAEEATYRDLTTETTETTVYCCGCDAVVYEQSDTRRETYQPFQ